MKFGKKSIVAALAAAAMFVSAGQVHAATMTVLGDTGSLRVVTPTLASNVSIAGPYGTSVFMPVITQTSATAYELDFVPTADFFASASAQPGGQTTTMDGKLDIVVLFPGTPIHLTTNVFEDGLWQTSGTGTVKVNGGLVVTAVDPTTFVSLGSLGESHGNTFGTANFSGDGTWKLFDQVTGFTGQYTAYKISIDNVLIAQALAPSPNSQGDAAIYKKDFSLLLTTDGSGGGGNIPEPASLGVLALGSLALLARRRKA